MVHLREARRVAGRWVSSWPPRGPVRVHVAVAEARISLCWKGRERQVGQEGVAVPCGNFVGSCFSSEVRVVGVVLVFQLVLGGAGASECAEDVVTALAGVSCVRPRTDV